MKKFQFTFLILVLLVLSVVQSSAAQIELWDYEFNLNGDIYYWGDTVPGLNDTAFDWATGLGVLSLTFNPGAGNDYSVSGFFDHDMYDDDWDGLFDDELTALNGTPSVTGEQWGQRNASNPGDAWIEIGYNDIDLAAGELAIINFILTETVPTAPFYIHHWDETNGGEVFLSSTLNISAIPEPTTVILFGIGLLGMAGLGRRKE